MNMNERIEERVRQERVKLEKLCDAVVEARRVSRHFVCNVLTHAHAHAARSRMIVLSVALFVCENRLCVNIDPLLVLPHPAKVMISRRACNAFAIHHSKLP